MKNLPYALDDIWAYRLFKQKRYSQFFTAVEAIEDRPQWYELYLTMMLAYALRHDDVPQDMYVRASTSLDALCRPEHSRNLKLVREDDIDSDNIMGTGDVRVPEDCRGLVAYWEMFFSTLFQKWPKAEEYMHRYP